VSHAPGGTGGGEAVVVGARFIAPVSAVAEVVVVRVWRGPGRELAVVKEDERLVRGNLEAAPARAAHDDIVGADHVAAQLGEHRAVTIVGTRRQPVLLDPANPPQLVLVSPLAVGACVRRRLGLGFLDVEVPLVERHARIIAAAPGRVSASSAGIGGAEDA